LPDKYLLFAIYLFYLYKVELNFDKKVQKEAFIQQLKADDRVKRLFTAAKQDKDLVDTEFRTIESWVGSALKECKHLGFVHFQDNDQEQFEILPAIWRIGSMYETHIRHITTLFTQTT
jgi:chromosome condensin MukBEF MukE localization factor